MLDLELLRSFISVVDAGGFTRAGERVHRTQSTVSQQIRRLEETLGYPLLHRNGKQVALTEQGERLLSYARRILALEQEAREVVTRPGSEGILRLGIPEDFAAHRLPELLSDFARARPGLRLEKGNRILPPRRGLVIRVRLVRHLSAQRLARGDALLDRRHGGREASQHFGVMLGPGGGGRHRVLHGVLLVRQSWARAS